MITDRHFAFGHVVVIVNYNV